MKFEEYLKTNLEFHEIKLVEYINNSINFGFEVFQLFLFINFIIKIDILCFFKNK